MACVARGSERAVKHYMSNIMQKRKSATASKRRSRHSPFGRKTILREDGRLSWIT